MSARRTATSGAARVEDPYARVSGPFGLTQTTQERMSRTPLALALICLAMAAALPATASASSGQLAIFQDDHQLLERGTSAQGQTLSEVQGLGADVIKVHVQWADYAPTGKRKPAGFNGADPSQYPAHWGDLDSLVRNAQARG